MGQKVHPTGFRIGITEPWRSRWYAPKRTFGHLLVEDEKIRKFVKSGYGFAAISKVEIERTREEVKVVLHSARPGLIIGRKGAEVDRLRGELEDLTGRRITVNIVEVRRPELSAQLVAEGVAQQLERRCPFQAGAEAGRRRHDGGRRQRRQDPRRRPTRRHRNEPHGNHAPRQHSAFDASRTY